MSGSLERGSADLPSRSEAIQPKDVVLTDPEQIAVFHSSVSYLLTHTRHEVKGILTEELVAINDDLRGVITRIASNLGEDKEYTPEEWLSLGITDFIPDNLLYEWANPSETPHWTEADFYNTARYLVNKKSAQSESQK